MESDKDYKRFTQIKVHYIAETVGPRYFEVFDNGHDRKQGDCLLISVNGAVISINMKFVWKVETFRS